MRTSLLLAILGAGLLAGCTTNPIAKSYQSCTKEWPPGTQERLLPPAAVPRVVTSTNLDEDSRRLKEEGFVTVGASEFQGALADPDQLIAQARKVGADTVLFSSRFSHTEQGVTPMMIAQTGPTYNNGQTYVRSPTSPTIFPDRGAYVNSPSGLAAAEYTRYPSAPMMSSGGSTMMNTPYQRPVFDQKAVFWRRTK